jgi:enamine deaminase RidA (YjgF/YER057c/UK114 family)
MTITRHGISSRMSQVVEHNGVVYLSGQIPNDWSLPIQKQTQEVLDNIDIQLAVAGSNKSRLLSATIWLDDIREFDLMNEIWESWVDTKNPPARTTCETRLAAPGVRVEITVVAAK